jgi:CelD/BcsL family acetyltransferase involved in cellulose biosynthesis
MGRGLSRRVIAADAIADVVPEWDALAERTAESPFETLPWLLPWLRRYADAAEAFVLTWWRDRRLVGVAPLVRRRARLSGIPARTLEFWGKTGTPLSGRVGLLADESAVGEVAADFGAWLDTREADWDVFDYLRLAPDSPAMGVLASSRGWRRVDLSRVLHSLEYVLDLPADRAGWRGHLGPKARHEIRRQVRLLERERGGRLEPLTDPREVAGLVATLRSLMAARWGAREAYFRRDGRFEPFLAEAVGRFLERGTGWALVARDGRGVGAGLVVLATARTAVAALIGVSPDPAYRRLSLGKCLFHRAIDDAVARGCSTFNFLTEGEYKRGFWHAQGRPVESGFVVRGAAGSAVAAVVLARRVLPARVRDAVRRRDGRHRP